MELIFNHIKIYTFDKKSAKIFGELKSTLNKNGIVVADIDLMIASITLANNETLISNNLKHFSKIEALKVQSWA